MLWTAAAQKAAGQTELGARQGPRPPAELLRQARARLQALGACVRHAVGAQSAAPPALALPTLVIDLGLASEPEASGAAPEVAGNSKAPDFVAEPWAGWTIKALPRGAEGSVEPGDGSAAFLLDAGAGGPLPHKRTQSICQQHCEADYSVLTRSHSSIQSLQDW